MAIRFDHITLFSTAHYAYPSLAASGQRIKILSEHGNATFGSDNSSWFHINTDRQGVYFEKRIQTAVDMRSPVFYDSNDTNYYLNPGSTSNLNNLTIYGTLSASLPYSSLTGTPDIPSISGLATTGYVTTAIENLVASAPGTLDTLNELAAALGDDANFSTTITNSIATKSGYNFGGTDLTFQGTDPGDIVWKNADGTETHRIWAGTTTNLTYRLNAGPTYALVHTGLSGYNSSNWDTAHGWGNHADGGYLTPSSTQSK